MKTKIGGVIFPRGNAPLALEDAPPPGPEAAHVLIIHLLGCGLRRRALSVPSPHAH
jgi:hypothetical protein